MKQFLVLMLALLNGSIFCDTDIDRNYESELSTRYDHNYNSLRKQSHKEAVERRKYSKKRDWERTNFIITDFLSDGEMERRLSLDGIAAKETSLGNDR